MEMQRYFLKNDQFQNKRVWITGQDAHHIVRVMRLAVGDKAIVCNENKACYHMTIIAVEPNGVLGEITEQIKENTELPVAVTVAQGLPKGDKFELILQKGTECGAAQFMPVKMERSVVKIDAKKEVKKIERWQKIVKEAAEQAHRQMVPVVHKVIPFEQVLTLVENFDICLFAYEEAAKIGDMSKLKKTLTKVLPESKILVLIGPEGGISKSEEIKLIEAGFTACAIGPRILRSETAPIYILSAISYALELS